MIRRALQWGMGILAQHGSGQHSAPTGKYGHDGAVHDRVLRRRLWKGPVVRFLDELVPHERAAVVAGLNEILSRQGLDVCATEYGKNLGKGLGEFRLRHSYGEIVRRFPGAEATNGLERPSVSMMSEPAEIIGGQVAWAERHGIPLDRSKRCRAAEDNLFVPLSPGSAGEFGEGAGNELGTGDTPGSMASVRSSSALAVNVFAAWRSGALARLMSLLAADTMADRLRFEVQYPTGLGGVPPHLDVVIDRPGGVPLAIESKFTEVYSPAHNDFRPSYLEAPGLWDGFGQAQDLALAIADGSTQFKHLGAAQLIKHALGLKNGCGPTGFRLLYLWYDRPGEIAGAHRNEIGRFAETVGGDFDFAVLTYQELFEWLREIPEPGPGYLTYLEDRYFSGE